jgi:AcrR family transcriptional regulator
MTTDPRAAAPARRERASELGEACIREALAIIEQAGIEALSLREVARRLGVSHQAPYRHYPSRDHLLAEVVRRGFEAFAAHLDARARDPDAATDLMLMGRAYLDYAARHPLQYRLIFGTPLPEARDHPGMMDKGRYAFGLLVEAIRALDPARSEEARSADPRLDALHVWAQLHGLATIAESSALRTLGFGGAFFTTMVERGERGRQRPARPDRRRPRRERLAARRQCREIRPQPTGHGLAQRLIQRVMGRAPDRQRGREQVHTRLADRDLARPPVARIGADRHQPPPVQRLQRGGHRGPVHRQELREPRDARRLPHVQRHQQRELPLGELEGAEGRVEAARQRPCRPLRPQAQAMPGDMGDLVVRQACGD